MAKRSSNKIKAMTPAKVAARAEDRRRKAVNDIGATVGLPEIQRDPSIVEIVAVDQIGAGARVTDKTIRKLTRVDMLARSGALKTHHVTAITRYADAAELAYGTVMRATQYGEGGGSSPTGAASAAHSRQLERAHDSDQYQAARSAIPGKYVTAFEALVIGGEMIGAVGAVLYPELSQGQISHNVREMVRTCADFLCAHFGIEGDDQRVHLAATMQRMEAAAQEPKSKRPTSDALDEVALRAVVEGRTGIIVSRSVLADIVRENGLRADPTSHAGIPLFVNDSWQFGWVLQG